MKMVQWQWVAMLVLLVSTGMAQASSDTVIAGLNEVREQQTNIREKVTSGTGSFKDMPQRQRDELLSRQDGVLKLIEGKSAVTELSEHDKTRLFNELEWIKSAISGNDDDRVVCERHRPSGSNRVQRTCLTVAERRRDREAAQQNIMQRNNCMDPAGCRAN